MVRSWAGIAVTALGIGVLGWLGSSADAPAPAPEGAQAPRQLAAADAAHNLARWREAGLSQREIDTLLFAAVESVALAQVVNPWDTYWRSGRGAALSYARGVAAAYGQVRRELETLRGAAARDVPEFARAFRPLEAEFGFLSSDEQVELQARRLQAQTGAGTQPPASSAPSPVPVEPALDFLVPAAAFEVRLRQSVEAEQLRGAGLELDERSFREALAQLFEMRGAQRLASHLRARRALRALLGESAFLRVQAVRDPQFAIVAGVVRAHGADDSAVEAAYAAIDEAQSAWLEAAAASRNGQPEPAAAGAIARREREELIAAVGEETAAAIADARARMRGRQNTRAPGRL
jgi:hypothetical protein